MNESIMKREQKKKRNRKKERPKKSGNDGEKARREKKGIEALGL